MTKSDCSALQQAVRKKNFISRYGDLSLYTDLLYPQKMFLYAQSAVVSEVALSPVHICAWAMQCRVSAVQLFSVAEQERPRALTLIDQQSANKPLFVSQQPWLCGLFRSLSRATFSVLSAGFSLRTAPVQRGCLPC